MKIERINIGELVRQKVSERGLSQAKFAELIGLQRQNIKKTVFEKTGIDTNLLCTISEVLEYNFFNRFSSGDAETKKGVGLIGELGSRIEKLNSEIERYRNDKYKLLQHQDAEINRLDAEINRLKRDFKKHVDDSSGIIWYLILFVAVFIAVLIANIISHFVKF